MIIVEKSKCCGCAACVQICPKTCIRMEEDAEGFLYPIIDSRNCVNCKLCLLVCPSNTSVVEKVPYKVYAAKNDNDDIRINSSSGGIFSIIANKVIANGGVVFGAKFNESWEVVHDYVENKEHLHCFRGSKYVQSKIGDTYKLVKHFLHEGRQVLFSGTPCQSMALKKYLQKDYENLLTVDFVCHGVPSPAIWRGYLKEELYDVKTIDASMNLNYINFRNKDFGWNRFSLKTEYISAVNSASITKNEEFVNNLYMKIFLSDLSLRPSCYNCPAKSGRSGTDITLGDFWGIKECNKDYSDSLGVSLVMINNANINIDLNNYNEQSYDQALMYNPNIRYSVNCPLNRKFFFMIFRLTNSIRFAFKCTHSDDIFMRIFRKLYSFLK